MGDGVMGGHKEMAGAPTGLGGGKAAPRHLVLEARTEDKTRCPHSQAASCPRTQRPGSGEGSSAAHTPRA